MYTRKRLPDHDLVSQTPVSKITATLSRYSTANATGSTAPTDTGSGSNASLGQQQQPPPLRQPQADALSKINSFMSDPQQPSAVVKMFCATGKSLVVYHVLENISSSSSSSSSSGGGGSNSVVVFPTIGLVTQFMTHYILKYGAQQRHSVLAVCSVNELAKEEDGADAVKYSTQRAAIADFYNVSNSTAAATAQQQSRVVLVTYQSLPTLLDMVYKKDINISVCLFDEAHHITGTVVSQLVLHNSKFKAHVHKQLYFTATPHNRGGVHMLPHADGRPGDCGPIIFDYNFRQAVKDRICRDFDVLVVCYDSTGLVVDEVDDRSSGGSNNSSSSGSDRDSGNGSHSDSDSNEDHCDTSSSTSGSSTDEDDEYEDDSSINNSLREQGKGKGADNQRLLDVLARAIARTGASRILTFHSGARKGNDAVIHFATSANRQLLQQHLQQLGGKHCSSRVILRGITTETKGRRQLLSEFDSSPDDVVYVLASCRTIGEGIDTKHADMVMFASPKDSSTAVQQITGRCTRRTPKHTDADSGIIVLPCRINLAQYNRCTTAEERDAALKRDIATGTGDFTAVGHYLMAMKVEDPDLMDSLIACTLGFGKPRRCAPMLTSEQQECTQQPSVLIAAEQQQGLCQPGMMTADAQQQVDSHEPHLRVQVDFSMAPQFQQMFQLEGVCGEAAAATAFLKAVVWQHHDTRWQYMLGLLQDFVNANGKQPGFKDVYKGEQLGSWCSNQRMSHQGGTLAPNRQSRLQDVSGWKWQIQKPSSTRWQPMLQLLREFVAAYGKQPSCSEKYKQEKLGRWCVKQKKYFKQGKLGMGRQQQLEAVPGWMWDAGIPEPADTRWQTMFRLLQDFVHANSKQPSSTERYKGEKLGSWCGCQRTMYKKGKLAPERQQQLKALTGWSWQTYLKDQEGLELLQDFVAEKGELPKPGEIYRGRTLGGWCLQKACTRRNIPVNSPLHQSLEAVPGWRWQENLDTRWHSRLELLIGFVNTHGKLPRTTEVHQGKRLGSWFSTQQSLYAQGKLDSHKQQQLDAVPGWKWQKHPQEGEWLQLLQDFVAENGRPPKRKETYHDQGLGVWCYQQMRKGRESNSLRQSLEAIPGWKWWERQRVRRPADEWLQLLGKFITDSGGRYPKHKEEYKGAKLGAWVISIRQAYKNGKLNKKVQDKLNSMPGWRWQINRSHKRKQRPEDDDDVVDDMDGDFDNDGNNIRPQQSEPCSSDEEDGDKQPAAMSIGKSKASSSRKRLRGCSRG